MHDLDFRKCADLSLCGYHLSHLRCWRHYTWSCCFLGFQSFKFVSFDLASPFLVGSFNFLLYCIAILGRTASFDLCRSFSHHQGLNLLAQLATELLARQLIDFVSKRAPTHSELLANRFHHQLAYHFRKRLGTDTTMDYFQRSVSSFCCCRHRIHFRMVFRVCRGFQLLFCFH